MEEAIAYAQKSGYDCIVMSSDRNSGCFALHDFIAQVPFYTQYPPKEYQKSPIQPFLRGSRNHVYSLGKYQLISIVNQSNLDDKCLYIIRPDEIQSITEKGYSWKDIHLIKDSRGIEYFRIIKISQK